jgi:hypothetical protein
VEARLLCPSLHVDRPSHAPLDSPSVESVRFSAKSESDGVSERAEDQSLKVAELSNLAKLGHIVHMTSLARGVVDEHDLSSVFVNLERALNVGAKG